MENRDILFRGKRIDNVEWVYGFYGFTDYHYIQTLYFGYDFFEVIPETVGQFTGLTDKNGTKIFEGDIITYNFKTKSSNDQFISPVTFDEYMWITEEHSLNRLNNIEITGNIHDKI